jgi:hypothetical protein
VERTRLPDARAKLRRWQGLKHVLGSAQPEPFLSPKPFNHQCNPQKVLTLSRKVEECKPLAAGCHGGAGAGADRGDAWP